MMFRLEHAPSRFNSGATSQRRLLYCVALLMIWLLPAPGAAPAPAKPTKPAPTRDAKLIDGVAQLPAGSFKTIEVVLPCEGTLSIDVAVQPPKGKDEISVFMVAPDQLAKMKAKQTFAHLHGFDSDRTRRYLRSARLAPGRYGLVIMTQSPAGSTSAINARVTARVVCAK